MKLEINIEKKHLFIFSLFLILLFSILTYSGEVSEFLPWHYVQQIAMGPAGEPGDMISIDSNKDGYVDNANNATASFACNLDDNCEMNKAIASEICLGGNCKTAWPVEDTNCITVETDDLCESGTATASGYVSGRGPEKSFNNVVGGLDETWQNDYFVFGDWLQYDFGSGNEQTIIKYKIAANTHSVTQTPSAWQFQGSNDGSNWNTLDTVSGETSWSTAEWRTFEITNTDSYRYYRFYITANNGHEHVMISEVEMIGEETTCSSFSGGGVPTGTIAAFNLNECPSGWQPADGEDGRPDLRGMFIRGLNDFGSSAGARTDGYEDSDGVRALANFQDQGTAVNGLNIEKYYVASGGVVPYTIGAELPEKETNGFSNAGGWTSLGMSKHRLIGDSETQPKNLAFIYCIKENGETEEDLSLFTDTGSQINVNDGKELYIKGDKVLTENNANEITLTDCYWLNTASFNFACGENEVMTEIKQGSQILTNAANMNYYDYLVKDVKCCKITLN